MAKTMATSRLPPGTRTAVHDTHSEADTLMAQTSKKVMGDDLLKVRPYYNPEPICDQWTRAGAQKDTRKKGENNDVNKALDRAHEQVQKAGGPTTWEQKLRMHMDIRSNGLKSRFLKQWGDSSWEVAGDDPTSRELHASEPYQRKKRGLGPEFCFKFQKRAATYGDDKSRLIADVWNNFEMTNRDSAKNLVENTKNDITRVDGSILEYRGLMTTLDILWHMADPPKRRAAANSTAAAAPPTSVASGRAPLNSSIPNAASQHHSNGALANNPKAHSTMEDGRQIWPSLPSPSAPPAAAKTAPSTGSVSHCAPPTSSIPSNAPETPGTVPITIIIAISVDLLAGNAMGGNVHPPPPAPTEAEVRSWASSLGIPMQASLSARYAYYSPQFPTQQHPLPQQGYQSTLPAQAGPPYQPAMQHPQARAPGHGGVVPPSTVQTGSASASVASFDASNAPRPAPAPSPTAGASIFAAPSSSDSVHVAHAADSDGLRPVVLPSASFDAGTVAAPPFSALNPSNIAPIYSTGSHNSYGTPYHSSHYGASTETPYHIPYHLRNRLQSQLDSLTELSYENPDELDLRKLLDHIHYQRPELAAETTGTLKAFETSVKSSSRLFKQYTKEVLFIFVRGVIASWIEDDDMTEYTFLTYVIKSFANLGTLRMIKEAKEMAEAEAAMEVDGITEGNLGNKGHEDGDEAGGDVMDLGK